MGKTTVIGRDITKIESDGSQVNVQNPFPTNGDSVYAKDIEVSESSLDGFTGKTIKELFSDYHTEMSDLSGTNPKTFTIHFARPIKSAMISMGSLTGNFSNVKIFLRDEQGNNIATVDDSANNTKFNSNGYPFPPAIFIEAVIEFHTVDPVKINGLYIGKYQDTTTVIQGLDDLTGEVTYAKFDNGEFIVGGKIGLKNASNQNINPATEEKQNDMIAALGGAVNYAKQYLIDSTDKYVAYSAQAVIASATSASVWRIKRITSNNIGEAIVHWADGNDSFDNILDNREGLSYS